MEHSTYRSFLNLVDASWKAIAGERLKFYGFVICYVIAYIIDLLIPIPIGYIIGILAKEGFTDKAYEETLYGIAVFVGLRFANTFFHHFGRYLQASVAYSARMDTLTGIFNALLTFPLKWHVKHHSGESLSKLHRSTGAIDSTIGTYVWQIVEGVVKTGFATVAIFALDTWVALTVLGMGGLTIIIMILFNARLIQKIRFNNAFYDKVNRICVDYLFNVVTVKTLGLENSAKHYLEVQRPEGARLARKIAKYQELKWGTTGIGYSLMMGCSLLIYFSGHRGLTTPTDIAQVYVLMNYLDKIFQAIGSFTGYYGGLIEASTAYEDASRILDESVLLDDKRHRAPLPPWDVMNFRDLEFYYDTTERAGLKGLMIDIKRGDKIALVGPSGGGKSTFLKIIGGLLQPEKLRLTVNGETPIAIESVSNSSLLLPQEPEIFSETLLYNLVMDGNFTTQEISFFIGLCRLQGVVDKLPKGWDSNLAEKGLNLSVGEKQRVAMARGLLRAGTREMLLLDEPTSSLDPKTEKEIFYGILHHFADRTVVTACHRLALVPLFDKIIYIREGRVEEAGGFKELLDKKGSFFVAWDDYQRKVNVGSEEEQI